MARDGKIKNFTGIDDPYEEPENPEIILDSDKHSIEELAMEVFTWLNENKTLALNTTTTNVST